ncbi:Rab GTPase-binding effector protein 1 [Trichinella sp. T8]|nr:Rab GTPase-binding effector protein 1 [Trichinella sp. T8]
MNNHGRSLSCSNLSSLRTEEATDEVKNPLTETLKDASRLSSALACEMCANYENGLQQYQETERRLRQQLTALQNLNERYKSELCAARLNHKELDSSVNEMMDNVSKQLTDLRDIFKAVELRHTELEGYFKGETANIRRELSEVIASRRKIEDVYQTLRSLVDFDFIYDHLLGRHRQGARQLEEEKIDLPQDVEELQLLCLQLKEELIESRTVKEHLEETLMSEIVLLKAEIASEKQAKEEIEASLADDICHLRSQLDCAQNCLLERESLYKWKAEAQSQFDRHRRRISELEANVKELEKDKLQAKELIQEGQRRAQVLQQELDNCVQVQRDFVKLSQSLQIQLEKIRQSEHERTLFVQVRWEDDDDVLMCRGCKQLFNRHRRKLHCRHCGRIFCDPCLSRTVSSGPQRKPAKVCEVCHTLLVSETAPYFSVEVPRSQLDGA